MKTKEKQSPINAKKTDAAVDMFGELTEDELEQVLGGMDEIVRNGSRPCRGSVTDNVLYTEQLGAGNTGTSGLVGLKDRNGRSLDIQPDD